MSSGNHNPQDPYRLLADTIPDDEPIPSGVAFKFPRHVRLENGSRAMESYVRPSPIVTAGVLTFYTFDLANCSFEMRFKPTKETDEMPSEIFVPDYIFRGGAETTISVSSGRWSMIRQVQVLRWWHEGLEEQTLKLSSEYRHTGMFETIDNSDFYFGSWIGRIYSKCSIL